MRSTTGRVLLAALVVVVAVVLFIVLQSGGGSGGGSPSGGPGGKVPTIVVKHGEPVGGVRDLSYNKGERIRFKVESDVRDEVHVHGYDIMKDVKAGGSVSFDFPATIEGVFEAELEGRKEQIVELTVNP
jgi:hypothetical protein